MFCHVCHKFCHILLGLAHQKVPYTQFAFRRQHPGTAKAGRHHAHRAGICSAGLNGRCLPRRPPTLGCTGWVWQKPFAVTPQRHRTRAPTCADVFTSFCWNMSVMSAFHCSQGIPGSVILKRGYLQHSRRALIRQDPHMDTSIGRSPPWQRPQPACNLNPEY